mgnify:CR=1 FL=1
MNEELTQLEAELRRLRPAPVSPALQRRIAADLSGAGAVPAPRLWSWLAVPAAAGLAAVLAQVAESRLAPAAATADGAFRPVAAEKLLVSARDEGVVTLDDGTTARRRRLHFLDTIVWRDPRTNASVTWTLPREEVRIVPVSFQ